MLLLAARRRLPSAIGTSCLLLMALSSLSPRILGAGAHASVHTGHDRHPNEHSHEAADSKQHEHAKKHSGGREQEAAAKHDDHSHEPGPEVRLLPEQIRILGLEIGTLQGFDLGETLQAPGEVRSNAYTTAQVTPRIAAQVVVRHARLGDHVERGTPLVTLSSVEMAQAQGDLIVAEKEWGRLTRLKGQFVSEREYLEASIARQKALSRVLAYGMTEQQTETLVQADSGKTDGTFDLIAPQEGTVVQDEFVLGERVEPGQLLFEITDESVRWVEARMPPEDAARVSPGDHARVTYRGFWLEGHVTQIHHLLDEATRTQAVRIEVPDPDHRLHPGVFVDVSVSIGAAAVELVLPETAVLRGPEGNWLVFVAESDGVFVPAEVELERIAGGMAVISGLAAGTPVVTKGAFFLQSELGKGGFDPHNH